MIVPFAANANHEGDGTVKYVLKDLALSPQKEARIAFLSLATTVTFLGLVRSSWPLLYFFPFLVTADLMIFETIKL